MRFYGGSESSDFRTAASVAQTNERYLYLTLVCDRLKHTTCIPQLDKFMTIKDKKFSKAKLKRAAVKYKRCRKSLKEIRKRTTKIKESIEGTIYESGVGAGQTAKHNALLCNALIQPHYDYACSAWYPSLNKRLSKKIQTSQNKCIRYCLNLDNRAHVGIDEFIKINWLPTKERVAQCICVNIFKFFNKMSPQYTSEIFHPSHSRYNTRMATLKLDLPFRQSCPGQKTISYLGPNTWNKLAAETKLRRFVNTFKHDIKKLFFDKLKKQNDDIFFYY